MSEIISNRGRHGHKTNRERQEQLKQIIKQLHEGKPVDEVRAQFEEAVGDVTVAEISALEQALIGEEGIPVEEVQRLCSVHTAVFKGSIQELHRSAQPEEQPGHPVHTFKLENRELERLLHFQLSLHMDRFMQDGSERSQDKVLEDLKLLMEIDKHYCRKENLLFPFLERYGIHGPTQVMWGVDDRIRADLKEVRQVIFDSSFGEMEERQRIAGRLRSLVQEMDEMIFKEENILLPMALQTLTEDEWVHIAAESGEIGYCLIEQPAEWKPGRAPAVSEVAAVSRLRRDGLFYLINDINNNVVIAGNSHKNPDSNALRPGT